jgi:hypothetical protein
MRGRPVFCKANYALPVNIDYADGRAVRECSKMPSSMNHGQGQKGLGNISMLSILYLQHMERGLAAHMPEKDPKLEALRQQGTLNPRPGEVTDGLFAENSIFDPRDLVRVKHEMLRRGPVGQRSCGFWFLAAILLSSAVGIRAGWTRRPDSAQTWAQAGAQAHAEF